MNGYVIIRVCEYEHYHGYCGAATADCKFLQQDGGHNSRVDTIEKHGQHSCVARRTRLVIPGLPHHLTQRGNRDHSPPFSVSPYLFVPFVSLRGF